MRRPVVLWARLENLCFMAAYDVRGEFLCSRSNQLTARKQSSPASLRMAGLFAFTADGLEESPGAVCRLFSRIGYHHPGCIKRLIVPADLDPQLAVAVSVSGV